MFFKLLVPYHSRQYDGGTVARWHKAPGDRVEFGDDLFDLHVSEKTHIRPVRDLRREIETLTQEARRFLQHRPARPRPGQGPPPGVYVKSEADLTLRVISSDCGVLRHILAAEGTACRIGDPVALLSAEEGEPLGAADEVVKTAYEFRVDTYVVSQLF